MEGWELINGKIEEKKFALRKFLCDDSVISVKFY